MEEEISDKFNEINKKRKMLEHLQGFIKQLHTMLEGMEPVQQIIKPSQKPSRNAEQQINQLMAPFEQSSGTQLKKALHALDKEVEVSLKFILRVASDDVDSYSERMAGISHEDFISAHELLMDKVQDFRRMAQTDVAVRLTMHKKGIPEAAGKLPISQDALNEKLSNIRGQEITCKKKIIDQARGIIKDINLLLDMDQCPQAIQDELNSFKHQIKDNLHKLKEGKEISAMPVVYDEMEMESQEMSLAPPPLPKEEEPPPAEPDAPTAAPEPKKEKIKKSSGKADTKKTPVSEKNNGKKPNIIKRAYRWLISPWNVKWKDLND